MSYRARRRLMWIVVTGGFVASLAVTAALFWNTAENVETFSGGKADIYVAPKPHTLTKTERASIVAVAQRFVASAVARNHPERAYGLAGPYLRAGLSKAQWATGEIPVVPYPVDTARWKVEYSNAESVGLLVMVFATAGAKLKPTVFAMQLVPAGQGGNRRWLVNGWAPKGTGSSLIGGSSSQSPGGAIAATAGRESERVAAKASPLWLMVPVVLICLVFVVPVAFLVRERRVERRMRRYLDSRAS